jgi:Fe2+ transport system protein FeoA
MNQLPLSLLAPGEKARLMAICGDHKLHKRLADLGLTIGMVVRVVQSDPVGPMILALRDDARLALGRGVAQKIVVEALE